MFIVLIQSKSHFPVSFLVFTVQNKYFQNRPVYGHYNIRTYHLLPASVICKSCSHLYGIFLYFSIERDFPLLPIFFFQSSREQYVAELNFLQLTNVNKLYVNKPRSNDH